MYLFSEEEGRVHKNISWPSIWFFSGPGHKLGGAGSSGGSSVSRAGARPGPSGSASGGSGGQPKTEDPEEIRRRRMAFLDKLQKSPQKQ